MPSLPLPTSFMYPTQPFSYPILLRVSKKIKGNGNIMIAINCWVALTAWCQWEIWVPDAIIQMNCYHNPNLIMQMRHWRQILSRSNIMTYLTAILTHFSLLLGNNHNRFY